jgi:hypothetical protein
VQTRPAPMEGDGPEFAVQPDKFNTLEVRVRLRIDEVYAPLLSRDVLRADVGLAELSILKNPQGTNFAAWKWFARVGIRPRTQGPVLGGILPGRYHGHRVGRSGGLSAIL